MKSYNPIFNASVSRYRQYLVWLISDSLYRFRFSAIVILAMGIAGVAFQAQAIVVAIQYAQSFSSGEPIQIFGTSYDSRTSFPLLVIASINILISLLLSAFLIYFSRGNILKLARKYGEFCSRRMLKLVCDGAFRNLQSAGYFIDKRTIIKLTMNDARLCGRALQIQLYMVVPALSFLVSLIALFYLSLKVTLIIVACSPIYLLMQYRVNKDMVSFTIDKEKLASMASVKYRSFFQKTEEETRLDVLEWSMEELFDDKSPITKQQNAFYGRLQLMESSRLISDILLALVIGSILLIMGGATISSGTGWGELLVYLIALNFALGNSRALFASFARLNRFYPQVRRYLIVINGFDNHEILNELDTVKTDMGFDDEEEN